VALAVFAIMAVAAYSGLSNVLLTRAAVEIENRRLAMAQLAFYRLAQDLEQVMPRSVRDEYGEPQPALRGNVQDSEALLFTRAGWDNPLGQPRASLQRVAYRLREGRLWRLHWDVLDQGGLSEPREIMLLDRVRALRLRFLDQDDAWRNDWPPPANNLSDSKRQTKSDPLPRAVEISLTLEDWGEITRLLLLPG
jgi:general secretion pathway protein J